MDGVRPTKRCLNDLGLNFPPLNTPLETVDHPLISKAQATPSLYASGGAERVLALTDHYWCKVKIHDHRGVAGEVDHIGTADLPSHLWWLVTAGRRQGDSPKHDFYDQITQECQRAARGLPQTVSSEVLLPNEKDKKRYVAEQAALAVESIKAVVRECLCRSAHAGDAVVAETDGHRIVGLVKPMDGESYVAVAAEGFIDPNMLAIILNAVPEVNADDWLPEPGDVLGIQPLNGQIVYSALLPASALAALLEESDGDFL